MEEFFQPINEEEQKRSSKRTFYEKKRQVLIELFEESSQDLQSDKDS